MLTAKQVGPLLGLSARKVYELARAGSLPSYRFDDAVRFAEADVEEYRRATTLPPRPLTTGREVRVFMRMLRKSEKAGDEPWPFELPPELIALAEERVRNLRMPAWADPKKVEAIYSEARHMTRETGIQHHVDHEIPVLGKFVSGLHVETNLRVLPARDNILKSNRFEDA